MRRARGSCLGSLGLVIAALLGAAGCATDEPGGAGGGRTLPTTTARFAAQYRVPVTDPALAAAAAYPVPELDWFVSGDVVTLHYDLPEGLVGGVGVEVSLSGPLDPGGATATLVGEVGTGRCEVTPTGFSCLEEFTGLPPLPLSMAVVEEVARVQHPGGVADRRAVATQFASDPIGIAEVIDGAPAGDDRGR